MPPLSDRSNSRTPSPTPIGSLPRKTSKRHPLSHLDSSEHTPSEHSSLFDAVYWRASDHTQGVLARAEAATRVDSKQHGTDVTQDNHAKAAAAARAVEFAVRYINNPSGTPLATIIERKSYATLKSKASSRRFTPVHVHPHSNYIHSAACSDARKRTSFSLDEQALREHELQRCEDDEHLPLKRNYVRPASPPHQPFQRTTTPPGRPRWPGDLPTSAPPAPLRSSSRQRFARVVRDVLRISSAPHPAQTVSTLASRPRRASMPVRTGRAYWRPPQSGYGVLGVSELARHPYQNAFAAANVKPGGPTAPALTPTAAPTSVQLQTAIGSPGTARQEASDTRGEAIVPAPDLRGRNPQGPACAPRHDTAAAILARSLSSTGSAHTPSEILDAVLDVSASIDRSPPASGAPSSEHATSPLGSGASATNLPPLRSRTRDDTSTRYTSAGIPIYRPDAPSPPTHATSRPPASPALLRAAPLAAPTPDQGRTYACPHITSAARTPSLAAPLTRVGSSTYAAGREVQRCWKCRVEDRVNAGVAWVLAHCFCQPGMEEGGREAQDAVRPVVVGVGRARWEGVGGA